jgi:hypothetical protein
MPPAASIQPTCGAVGGGDGLTLKGVVGSTRFPGRG